MSAQLFSSYNLGPITLRNRLVLPPMCLYSADEHGMPKSFHLAHYMARASGGVGLVIQEATAIAPEGRITGNDLGLWNDAQAAALAPMVAAIKSQGALVGVQIGHAGRKCTVADTTIYAPSPIPFDEKSRTPVALDDAGLDRIVTAFQLAAKRAVSAGYDLIEVHAAHGYLLSSFLSPLTNTRTDNYGGSTQNRARLLGRVLTAVREVLNPQTALIVRVSAEDYAAGGMHPDEMVRALSEVKSLIHAVHVSSGGVLPVTVPVGPGYQVAFSEKIRREVGVPTIAVGMITTPAQAETIVRTGQADLVALGRELLRNPAWPCFAAKELGATIPCPGAYSRAWA